MAVGEDLVLGRPDEYGRGGGHSARNTLAVIADVVVMAMPSFGLTRCKTEQAFGDSAGDIDVVHLGRQLVASYVAAFDIADDAVDAEAQHGQLFGRFELPVTAVLRRR